MFALVIQYVYAQVEMYMTANKTVTIHLNLDKCLDTGLPLHKFYGQEILRFCEGLHWQKREEIWLVRYRS